VFAEENHRLLLKFMRSYDLDDDYYGCLAEQYVLCVKSYLESERLQKYAFSTILWRYLKTTAQRFNNKFCKDVYMTVSVDAMVIQPGRLDDYDADLLWHEIGKRVTESQLEILQMKALGFTEAEIAERRSCSRQAINQQVAKIKERFKRINLI